MTRAPLIALCTLLSLPGCSLILVDDAPPVLKPNAARECTSTRIWPIADTAIAILAAAGAIYLVRSDDSLDRLGAGIEGAIAIGFGYSAWHGWTETNQCRRLRSSSMP